MQNSSHMAFESKESWTILSTIEQSIKKKIETIGTPLKEWDINIYRGILTGFNEAFIISGEKKDELIAADPKSAEIIRPILRGRDIKRYDYEFANLWLINAHNGVKEQNITPINIADYPAIKSHLDQYYEKLAKRADKGCTPYNLRNCAYMDDFSKQKICWIELTDESKFSYSDDGIYLLNTVFFMVGENIKYLIAALNSSLIRWYFLTCIGTTSGVGTNRWLKYTVETIPIVRPSDLSIYEISNQVDKVIEAKKFKQNSAKYEHEIDVLLMNSYNLTYEEQQYILSFEK